jgi:hypothetical protein
MKKLTAIIAGLALAGAAFASVDPTRPMVTGRGNVAARPGKAIVTNATDKDQSAGETTKLEKFEVTGSLMKNAQSAKKPARR